MNRYIMLCMVLNLKAEFQEGMLIGKPTPRQNRVIKGFDTLIKAFNS